MSRDKNRRLLIALIFLSLVAGFANWYMRKIAVDSYAAQFSYNQLYLDPAVVRLKHAVKENDNLVIKFAGDTSGIAASLNGRRATGDKSFLFTPGDSGKYFLIKHPNYSDSMSFYISYASRESRRLAANAGVASYAISGSKLNYSDSQLYGVDVWAYSFTSNKKKEGQSEVSHYIRDSIGISGAEGSMEKIRKIFDHIMPFVKPNLGIPADSVSNMPVLELLDRMKRNEIKVWCGNLSEVLGFFASQSGLPCRVVSTEGDGRFPFIVHTFIEIYIPEDRKWIYSDLTTGVAYMTINGNAINIVDINRLLRLGFADTVLEAMHFDDTLHRVAFGRMPSPINLYFNAPHKFRFYFAEYLTDRGRNDFDDQIRRLALSRPNYVFYSEDNQYSNNNFYWKQVSSVVLLSIIAIDFVFLFFFMNRRKTKVV